MSKLKLASGVITEIFSTESARKNKKDKVESKIYQLSETPNRSINDDGLDSKVILRLSDPNFHYRNAFKDDVKFNEPIDVRSLGKKIMSMLYKSSIVTGEYDDVYPVNSYNSLNFIQDTRKVRFSIHKAQQRSQNNLNSGSEIASIVIDKMMSSDDIRCADAFSVNLLSSLYRSAEVIAQDQVKIDTVTDYKNVRNILVSIIRNFLCDGILREYVKYENKEREDGSTINHKVRYPFIQLLSSKKPRPEHIYAFEFKEGFTIEDHLDINRLLRVDSHILPFFCFIVGKQQKIDSEYSGISKKAYQLERGIDNEIIITEKGEGYVFKEVTITIKANNMITTFDKQTLSIRVNITIGSSHYVVKARRMFIVDSTNQHPVYNLPIEVSSSVSDNANVVGTMFMIDSILTCLTTDEGRLVKTDKLLKLQEFSIAPVGTSSTIEDANNDQLAIRHTSKNGKLTMHDRNKPYSAVSLESYQPDMLLGMTYLPFGLLPDECLRHIKTKLSDSGVEFLKRIELLYTDMQTIACGKSFSLSNPNPRIFFSLVGYQNKLFLIKNWSEMELFAVHCMFSKSHMVTAPYKVSKSEITRIEQMGNRIPLLGIRSTTDKRSDYVNNPFKHIPTHIMKRNLLHFFVRSMDAIPIARIDSSGKYALTIQLFLKVWNGIPSRLMTAEDRHYRISGVDDGFKSYEDPQVIATVDPATLPVMLAYDREVNVSHIKIGPNYIPITELKNFMSAILKQIKTPDPCYVYLLKVWFRMRKTSASDDDLSISMVENASARINPNRLMRGFEIINTLGIREYNENLIY